MEQVLLEAGFDPQRIDDAPGYSIWFNEELVHHAAVFVAEDDEQLVCYLDFTDRIPLESLGPVAEFISRANFGLSIGNFELDFDSGVARFKSSVDYGGNGLTPALVRNAVSSAIAAVEAYGDALVAVATGRDSPAAAIASVESETG